MAALMAVISAASTVASGGLKIFGGLAEGKAKKEEMFKRAGEERALGQREFGQKLKETNTIISNNQARAAASGASASDESSIDLTGDIYEKGYTEALTAANAGENRARGFQDSGRSAMRAAELGALGTAFDTVGKLAKSFGGDFKDYMGKSGGGQPRYENNGQDEIQIGGRMYG